MFRHYRVILRELVINTLQSYTSISNAAVGNTIDNYRISRPIRRTVIFSLEILEKDNDEGILILVIYWKKTGLLHTKISNHNTIYSSHKPRKSSSLSLKSSSWLFSRVFISLEIILTLGA